MEVLAKYKLATEKCLCIQCSSPSVCPVDADFVNLSGVLAEILDVTEYMAATVLANEVAEVSTQTHVRDSRLVVTP